MAGNLDGEKKIFIAISCVNGEENLTNLSAANRAGNQIRSLDEETLLVGAKTSFMQLGCCSYTLRTLS